MKQYFLIFHFLVFQVLWGYSQSGAIKVSNTSKKLSHKKGYYNWTVFIDARQEILSSIDYVEYLLHPTFRRPLQRVTNSKKFPGFSYTASGWGEFNIKVKIVYQRKEQKPSVVDYWLKLGR